MNPPASVAPEGGLHIQIAVPPAARWIRRRPTLALAFSLALLFAGEARAALLESERADARSFGPRCTLVGTNGADRLRGTAGADTICGRGGNDVLLGRGGRDRLLGGAGRDLLRGGGGDDILRGDGIGGGPDSRLAGKRFVGMRRLAGRNTRTGAGDDVLRGGPGDDILRGGAGGDVLRGGAGDDILRGGAGGDVIAGGPGSDLADYLRYDAAVRLSIGDGANDGRRREGDDIRLDVENLRGGSGDDTLRGSAGENRLHGFRGRDRFHAGAGDDLLSGGLGGDMLDGRDAASFSDILLCGGGADAALADMADDVRADCEDVTQNDAPTDLSLSRASVAENEPTGATVGTLSATDPDARDTHVFSLVSGLGAADNGSFTVAGTTLRTNAVFDYETKNSYSVRIRVTDSGDATYEEQFTISVTNVVENRNPVAADDSATTMEDTQLQLPVSGAGSPAANDTDADSDPLTVTAVSNPAGGTASISGGMIRFNPTANLCGTGAGRFDYTVSDGRGGSDIGRVSVDITCVNDSPVAVDDSATALEDAGAGSIDVLANDADPDGGAKAIDSVTQPANGTVAIMGGGSGLTYEPDADYCNDPPGTSPDTFTYTLTPGGSTATVSVTVTCVAEAPTAVDDSATVLEDAAATAIEVLANDTDPDGGAKAIDSVTQPANGTVAITGGGSGLTYEPDANYCNDPPGTSPDTFTYTLTPGGSTATVSVTVTCVADAPTAVDDSATALEDAGAGSIDVLANDTDPDGGPRSIASVTQPANGTVVITGGGSGLTYEPDPNYCNAPPGTSPDVFSYTLTPGGSTAMVSVTVTCVDDPPTAVGDTATVAQDSAATTIDVLANDTDPDGGAKAIASVTQPANGTVVITGAGSGLTYQPDASYCNDPPGTSPDTFTYTLTPGGSTATVSVTVTCLDDPPTAVNDAATVSEDAAATAIDVLANDTDPDGGAKSIDSVTQPANGTVVITGGGSGLTYQPNANYCNAPPGTTPDTFTYTLSPGGSTAIVSVTVTCIDDPPTAVNDAATVLEDAAATAVDVLANDTDPDGGPKTISSASDPANGTVLLTGGSPGAHTGLTYQPDPNYCNDPPGTTPDTFTYTVNGGSTAMVSVTVTCSPDNPVVDTSAGATSYTENGPATAIDPAVTLTDSDAGTSITGATIQISGGYAGAQDILALAGSHPGITASLAGDTLTLTGNASPAAYQAALRDVTYRNSSDNPSTAARTITFTVTDDTSRSGSDTKGITVTAVDDPPTAVNDSATVLEDAAATAIPVLANDTDVDGGPKTISSASDPANGTVVLTGGSPGAHTGLTYQPDPNYCNDPPGTTPDTFTYTVNGGSSATVSMTVTCVNDAPVADDETFNGNESAHGNTTLQVDDPDDNKSAPTHPHTEITGDILAGDTDIDGPGPLTVTAGTFATNDGGSVTIESDGDFTFQPAASTSCTDTSDFFDYTVEDSGSPEQTDTGRVTIAIAGCVWYVSNNAAGNSGTSAAPFDTLAQAETASGANHTVFVFDGDNTATGLDAGGYAMNAGERLIGEHEGLVVDPDGGGALTADTLHPANPGAHPTLTATNADVIDLDDGNEVRGFNLDPQGTGGGIAGTAGDTGGGTIDDVNVVDTLGAAGTQAGLELNGTMGTFNVSNFTVTNNATGVLLNNAGTVNFTPAGTITIVSAGAPGLSATNTNMGTSTFDSITVTGSATGGVSITNPTNPTPGSTTFGDLSLTTTGGTGFLLSNAGTVSVPAAGTDNVNATGGPAIDVTGTTVTTLAFDDVDSTNSTGDGINLDGLGSATFSAANTSTITGAAGIAFDLNGGSGDVMFPGTITNGEGSTAEITGRTGGTVTFSGPITESGDADATQENGGIAVTGNSGGSTVISNATKTFNTGEDHAIVMGTSDGHTLTLSGNGLDIDTTTGQGISANNSGTLVVSGTGNTIDSVSATALNVTNTDIGVGGATFQRISSGNSTAAADPANGIVLNGTGSSAGLTVTGNGNSSVGGDSSGGTIQSTTGHGVNLASTLSPSFTNLNLQSTGGAGINGTQISNFTFANGTINNSGDALGESSIAFNGNGALSGNNINGTLSVTNSVLTNAFDSGIHAENNAGTISNATITGNTMTSTTSTTTSKGDGVRLVGTGTTSTVGSLTKATITNNTIRNFPVGGGIQVNYGNSNTTGPAGTAGIAGDATNIITITNNTIRGFDATTRMNTSAVLAAVSGGNSADRSQGNFNISNNGTVAQPLGNTLGTVIGVGNNGFATMTATVNNNVIVANNTVGSNGIGGGNGVVLGCGASRCETPNLTMTANGNTISQTDGNGILLVGRGNGSGALLNLSIKNNTVAAPLGGVRPGIRVDAGNNNSVDDAVCLDISGNTSAGSGGSQGIGLRKQGTVPTTNDFGIEGMAATSSPGVEAFVDGLNPAGGGTLLISATSGFSNCSTAP